MKKALLFPLAFGLAATAFAQTADPVVLPEFYSMRISPDGSVIVSQTDATVSIYDVKKGGDPIVFEYFDLGSGNCITTDGSVIVGSTDMDRPLIVKNGEMVDLTGVGEDYMTYNFTAITGDGSRIVGYASNNDESETMWIPMYIEVSADGNLGDPHFLPYPHKDWCDLDPQYVVPTYISNDGKTILGQLQDNTGGCSYPVLFKEGADGTWSYSLPTEAYINPDNLPLPEFPGEFEVPCPQPEDYMTDEEKANWQNALDAWAADGYDYSKYPNIADFMSPENVAAYNNASEEYNRLAEEFNQKFEAYFDDLEAIKESSLFFCWNGLAMDTEGKMVGICAQKSIESETSWFPVSIYPCYILNLETNELTAVEHTTEGYPLPNKVFSDGTILGTTPVTFGGLPPQSYVIPAGTTKYIPLEDYLSTIAPTAATWLKENYTKQVITGYDYDPETYDETPIFEELVMTGHACVSDDWKVITGGVMAYLYSEDNTYESYVIQTESSGVKTIGADATVKSVTYYDLNGLKVMNPAKGMYVSRTVYSDGTVVTSKVAVK